MAINYSEMVVDSTANTTNACNAYSIKLRSEMKLGTLPDENHLIDVVNSCIQANTMLSAYFLKLDWLHIKLNQAHENKDSPALAALLGQLQQDAVGVEAADYNNLTCLKNMVMAKAFLYTGNDSEAVDYAQKCIDGSRDSGNTYQFIDCLRILLHEAEANNNYQQALSLSKKIRAAENTIYSKGLAKQMAYMSVKHNMLAKQVEIQKLQQNNQVLALENQLSLETKKRQNLFMMLVAVLLLLVIFWGYKLRKRGDYYRTVSEIDHLTQVFSRKAIEERVPDLLNKAQKQGAEVHLAIMDLDHFKNINDEYGHLIGDWVLKHVMLACEAVADEDVLMGRLGGEEFLVLTPGIDQTTHLKLLEKMRQAIQTMDASAIGHDFHVTASFGTSSTLVSGYDFSALLGDADNALFTAKHDGRNNIKVHQPAAKTAS